MARSIHDPNYRLLLKQLRALRESKGRTQVDLARSLNTTQTFVSKCERGERRLDLLDLFSYLDALGADPVRFVSAYRKAVVSHARTGEKAKLR
jgi:transcriptional regulator with XRE-family HTH domain